MYWGLFLTLLLVTAVYPKYLPSNGGEGKLKHELLRKSANAVAPTQLEIYEDTLDDYSDILTSANWRNDKTENIWIHGNLSDQTSSVRPPGNKGFIEINYPSGSASYAHYHSLGFLTFPKGGSLQLDYWLVAKSKFDVELLVQMIQTSSHDLIPIVDLTSTYTDPIGSWWKSVEVAIPASNEQVQLCIQGYRKMHLNSGLAIARIYVHNNSNNVVTSTEYAATTNNPIYTTIKELTTEVTTEVIPDTTTENTSIELLDDYSEIVTSTNWQNNKEDNIWVHSSVSEESDALLRPPEGQGFIEINYPSGNNSYAHYHTIDQFTFPRGGLLELVYWLEADALSDSQLRIFTLLAKTHDITLANITLYENNNPDSKWQTIKVEIPILGYPVQICIQGHRRRIDSSGLAITRIYVRQN